MEFKRLKHHQINKQKWDATIQNSFNGLVCALSWYLNVVSPDWEALVAGDYELIMPLPVKQKYGFRYLIQPPFCQQLGIFCMTRREELIPEFIKQINSEFRFAAINLNFNPMINCVDKSNFELDLSSTYDFIKGNYSTNTKRNINKAVAQNLKIIENISPVEVWKFKKENPVNRLSNWHYKKLLEVLNISYEKDISKNFGLIDSKNNLMAVVSLIEYKERITFLVSSSNKQGKEKFAMFYMVDWIIQKYTEKNIVFDFEGGSLKNLARFFGSFGAVPVKYYHYKRNNLIWPLNKLV
ncbi:MAG TPA: hypothetical protein DCG75_15580 [Bacteroidales bacterium]|nr:hypothetical protein [Bacteroidales bacterium]